MYDIRNVNVLVVCRNIKYQQFILATGLLSVHHVKLSASEKTV